MKTSETFILFPVLCFLYYFCFIQLHLLYTNPGSETRVPVPVTLEKTETCYTPRLEKTSSYLLPQRFCYRILRTTLGSYLTDKTLWFRLRELEVRNPFKIWNVKYRLTDLTALIYVLLEYERDFGTNLTQCRSTSNSFGLTQYRST